MSVPDRRTLTTSGRLARLGLADVDLAQASLAKLPPVEGSGDAWLDDVADAADPDLALAGLVRLPPAVLAGLAQDPPARRRLVAVLGASQALADHLARHPDHARDLGSDRFRPLPAEPDDVRSALLAAVGADPGAAEPVASGAGPDVLDALRVGYHRQLLGVAARDLVEAAPLDLVGAELADLAAAALEAGLAIARAELPPDAAPCRLAVIAMGKCGGRELNYVSDVDVIFVAEAAPGADGDGTDEAAALATATRLATGLMRACSTTTPEGSLWPVDPNLRPEGKAGALVRTVASHVAYYERWAATWEYQALLKARPVAGDRDLGTAYAEAVAPFVWAAAERDGFVEDVRAMRRRVEEHVPDRDADRALKLGRGGLRDVEFAVQLLQLVHGRSDVFVRSPTTLVALEQLSTHGYVGRTDAAELDRAYRFLRMLEHRLQLHRLRRTHVVPADEAELRRVARSMGYRTDPVAELTADWRRHRLEVRRLHEKLFYRPLLNAVARLEPDEARLTPQAAGARLEALGYADPVAALRHLEVLTAGVSRRAAIQRHLLPVMLGWFAEGPDPDAGLLGFRQVSDALGTTHWYLGLLRDAGAAAERLARVLASSRFATDLLLRAPEAVRLLGEDGSGRPGASVGLEPRSREALTAEVLASTARNDDPETAIGAVRAVRRRELFRIAAADVLGELDETAVGHALTDVAAATVTGALDIATRALERARGGPLPTRLAVVGMGRFGGGELGYSSDADVLFVHDPLPGAEERDATDAAHAVANEMRRLLALPGPDPQLLLDADLRPEGRQGPLVRSLASYAAYYDRWSLVWESQALLRAVPVAGDPALGQAFVELVDPVRYPSGGLAVADAREVRRIKARVEAERLPRGADPTLHVKLGRGGLADVEWTVQLLQLQHAGAEPTLRTPATLPALAAAAGTVPPLLDPADAAVLSEAWRLATRVRNAVVLVRGRPADSLPSDTRELAAVARVLGYAPGRTGDLVEDYRRSTRRARAVVERVFYT